MKLFFLFGLILSTLLSLQNLVAQTEKVDFDALAQKLVTQSAAIKEGEIVLITGSVREMELLEDIAVHVRSVGAFPLISIGSDRVTHRMFTDVPEKYDAQEPGWDKAVAGIVNAVISITVREDEALLADIPPERLKAAGKAAEGITKIVNDRKVRFVSLGNGLYPTKARAERFNLSQNQLRDIFWNGVNIDPKRIQATGEAVRRALEKGKRLHITSPSGTDLTMSVEDRKMYISDGAISDEDMKQGPAGYTVWLPAGEAYLSPVPGTVEGKLVIDKYYFQGKPVEGLEMTFKGGKVASMTGKSGFERLKAQYDEAPQEKEEFGYIDFGVNPNMMIPAGTKLENFVSAGMVTVGLGTNTWAGGTVGGSYSLPLFLADATVTIDGKKIVENGKLLQYD